MAWSACLKNTFPFLVKINTLLFTKNFPFFPFDFRKSVCQNKTSWIYIFILTTLPINFFTSNFSWKLKYSKQMFSWTQLCPSLKREWVKSSLPFWLLKPSKIPQARNNLKGWSNRTTLQIPSRFIFVSSRKDF